MKNKRFEILHILLVAFTVIGCLSNLHAATLNIQSTPVTGIPIIASPSSAAGTTNYTKTGLTGAVSLTAPETHNGMTFVKWIDNWGDEYSSRYLQIAMVIDWNLTVVYQPSVQTDLVALAGANPFFMTEPAEGGTFNESPCEGDIVYAHFTYRVNNINVASVPWQIKVDGLVIGSGSGSGDLGYHTVWCTSPWTVAGSGSHTLTGIVDPSGNITETNEGNNSNSDSFSVGTGPIITQHPVSQLVNEGDSVMFSVTATGATGYQWRKNGINITGANSSIYTINSATSGDIGNYDCIVSNSCDSVTSNTATLSVNIPSVDLSVPTGANPFFMTQPAEGGTFNEDPCEGDAVYAHFCYRVTGGDVPTVPWEIKVDSSVIGSGEGPGTVGYHTVWCTAPWSATVGNHTLTGIVDPSGIITETNEGNNSNSDPFLVGSLPMIIQDPTQIPNPACQGDDVTFTVSATGAIDYQWYMNSTPVGSNSPIYEIYNIPLSDNGAVITCEVSNGCGTVSSLAWEIVIDSCECPLGDLDGDCDVDIADFAIFSQHWLEGTE